MKNKILNLYIQVKREWSRVVNLSGPLNQGMVRMEASIGPLGVLLNVIIGIVGIVGLILLGLVLFTGSSIKGNIKEVKDAFKDAIKESKESKEVDILPPKVKSFHNSEPVKVFRSIGWWGFIYSSWFQFLGYEPNILHIFILLVTLSSFIYTAVIGVYEMYIRGKIRIKLIRNYIKENFSFKDKK